MEATIKNEATVAKKPDDFVTSKWRPMMGWQYMVVCIFDFIVMPILWIVVQFWEVEAVNDAFRQWSPLTLQGAGLYHMAMGAVLGITAWSRGQEKMAGATGQPLGVASAALPVATPPAIAQPHRPTSAPVAASTFAVDPAAAPATEAVIYRNGKPAPVQPDFPER